MNVKRHRSFVLSACSFAVAAVFVFLLSGPRDSDDLRTLWVLLVVLWAVIGVYHLVQGLRHPTGGRHAARADAPAQHESTGEQATS